LSLQKCKKFAAFCSLLIFASFLGLIELQDQVMSNIDTLNANVTMNYQLIKNNNASEYLDKFMLQMSSHQIF
jgi:hypothetical protein